MKKQSVPRIPPESFGQRLAFPVVLIGSLFAIAMFLYALDATPVRAIFIPP